VIIWRGRKNTAHPTHCIPEFRIFVQSTVRQWLIKDVDKIRHEESHVYLDLGGTSPVSLDFQAASKQEAEAIFNEIQISRSLVRHSMLVSTCQTTQGSPNASGAHVPYHESEPILNDEEQYIELGPVCEGRWGIAMYDFQAETEEELTIKENDELWVLDHVSSDGWLVVQLGDQVGIVPASYVRINREIPVAPYPSSDPTLTHAPVVTQPARIVNSMCRDRTNAEYDPQ
jgi:hypothetical protein